MSDIDVSFSTNAAQVAPQIDQVAASTAKASAAAKAHGATAANEASALKAAAVAAREKAAAENADAAATSRANAAARQRATQAAGFLGAGRFAGGAQAIVGKDAGVGSLIATTAILGGVGIAIGLLTDAIGKWWGKVDEQIKATEKLSQQYDDIRKANIDKGISAGRQLGGSITAVTALGKREQLADLMGRGFGAQDAASAIVSAERFKGRSDEAIAIAARLSRTLGVGLSDAMGDMPSRLGPGTAAAVASKRLGRRVTPEAFDMMQLRAGESQEIQDVRQIQLAGAMSEGQAIADIGRGATTALREAIEAQTAESRKLAEQLESWNTQQREAEERRKAAERFMQAAGASFLGDPLLRSSSVP